MVLEKCCRHKLGRNSPQHMWVVLQDTTWIGYRCRPQGVMHRQGSGSVANTCVLVYRVGGSFRQHRSNTGTQGAWYCVLWSQHKDRAVHNFTCTMHTQNAQAESAQYTPSAVKTPCLCYQVSDRSP